MATAHPDRGQDLIAGARALRSGPAWFARLIAGRAEALLDRIDRGLECGSIEVVLPTGQRRMLGGRAPGFAAQVRLNSWRALLRIATAGSIGLYQGWEAGDWESPDSVPLFALFMYNAENLGDVARPRGPWRWLGRALNFLRRNSRAGSRRNVHAHYDLGNDFYQSWLDPDLVYSSARFDGGAEGLVAGQQRKLDTIAERVVSAGSVLEIGCGWGALAQRLHKAGRTTATLPVSLTRWSVSRWSRRSAANTGPTSSIAWPAACDLAGALRSSTS
jgi:cyclopropane-fatty-acyl-phospholipid synthase